MREFRGNVIITDHAKERFIQRRVNSKVRDGYVNVYKKMLNMIFRSTLVGTKKQPNGEVHEYRSNKGCIFVCARRYAKNFWEKDEVTILTVKLNKWYIEDRVDRGIDINTFGLNDIVKQSIRY
ncbi:MAG: hypothetical protein ACRDCW_06265 [Sarcina sp.]